MTSRTVSGNNQSRIIAWETSRRHPKKTTLRMTFVPATLLPDQLRTIGLLAASKPGPEIAAWRARIDDFLRAYLTRQRADYLSQPVFAPLYDDVIEFVCRPGKRLRPLLFLMALTAFSNPHAPVDTDEMASG